MRENKFIKFLKKHRKMVCIVAVILVLLLIFLLVFRSAKGKKAEGEKQMGMQTQTARITKMDLSTSISVTGTIASADNRSISAGVSGVEVTKVNVEVGDYVNAGDTIVTLDSSTLEEELTEAQEDYELAVTKSNKNVDDAAENLTDATEAYTEGLSAQASAVADALSEYNDAVSAESDQKEAYEKAVKATEKAKEAYEKVKEKKSELKKAMNKAQKANQKAQKALEEAAAAYEKAQTVSKDENGNIDETVYQAYMDAKEAAQIAESEYQKAESDYNKIEQAKTAYQEAKKAQEEALKVYEEATGVTSTKYKDYEKALDTQEETNEKNAEQMEESEYNYSITKKETASSLKNQKTQVQNAEEKLGECVITSPISGVITSISVEEGDTYENGEMFVVQDMSSFIVEATVDEYDISDIAKEMEAVVKTDATDDEELAGIVTYVAPTPESSGQSMGGSSSSATYKIQISLTEANERLRVGMTAKTSIILSSAKDVLAVPYDYVQTDEEGNSYVEVMDSDSGQKKVTVTKGMESDYYVEIQSDELTEGMTVVAAATTTSQNEGKEASEEGGALDSFLPSGGMPTDAGGGERGGSNRGGGDRSGGMPSGGGPGGF